MPKDSLNPKQKRFVEEYLIDLNATQAAIRAGYSKKTAGIQGFDLLKNPKVQGAIAKAQEKLSKRVSVTQEEVIEGLKGEATYHGRNASPGARVSAWNLLGKHIGMFKDNKLELPSGVNITGFTVTFIGNDEANS